MDIRNYNNEDQEKILEIWYEASKIAHSFLNDELLQAQKIQIKEKYLPIAETWVAEDMGCIWGFVSLLDNYVGGLFIHPRYQGKGVGTALINKASTKKGSLTVGVYEKNKSAKKFYEKVGFSFIDQEIQTETGEVILNMILDK